MEIQRYFDNAATTPLDPQVLDAMLPYLQSDWGNANSLHEAGRKAMAAVDRAREQVALLINAEDPAEIVFTSGATEANNWILRSFPDAQVSPFEHSSMYEAARHLGNKFLRNDGYKVLPPDESVSLVSLMKVNNETGTIFDPVGTGRRAKAIHSDVTQAVGKIPLSATDYDFASFSGHKFYGPKGIGALFVRGGAFPEPLLYGGEQEHGIRAGTLNVPGIVGMGAAAQLARERLETDHEHAKHLRKIVLESLAKSLDVRVNGGSDVLPHILSLSFRGIEGETVVVELDRMGFAISSGAACSSRSTEPSHVLTALGMEPEWIRGTVRISFGRFNTEIAAANLADKLNQTAQSLIKMTD